MLWLLWTYISIGFSDADFNITDFNSTDYLSVVGSAYFQTCNKIPGLPYIDTVLSQDSSLITQYTVADYPNPRNIVNFNFTRSKIEEFVRRRDEMQAKRNSLNNQLAFYQSKLKNGVEPDVNGQVWLLIQLTLSDINKMESDYQNALLEDKTLYLTRTQEYRAIWPRNSYDTSYVCDNRIRLNPPAAHSRGGIWHKKKQRVANGFNTTFTFQISARNQECVDAVQAHATNERGQVITHTYSICEEKGADGFAFVIQNNASNALGNIGAEIGYGNLTGSLVVEFDMFANRDLNDPNGMHVAIHLGGPYQLNAPTQSTRVGFYSYLNETNRNLKDGNAHVARIVYTPGLNFNPFEQPQWKSTSQLADFLKADGLGTFRVFVDDMSTAVINIPISLKYAVPLDNNGSAWVGFTAATGDGWENHDILAWQFSENVL